MKDILDERKNKLETFHKDVRKQKTSFEQKDIPEGLFVKCEHCQAAIYEKTLELNAFVCLSCDYHFKINADQRLSLILDEGSFQEIDATISSLNPLNMANYSEKLDQAKKQTGMNEAFKGGFGLIDAIPVAIGVLDSGFIMGSMGSAVGEKITRLIEYAAKEKRPLVLFSASGGARMQEGILSLMQMVKTASALNLLAQAGLFFLSVLTNPTTGGVAASFASLGDIVISEKSSLIGFAGARVIKQTINQDLPEGFQTETFALAHGQIDLICHRHDLRQTIANILKMHSRSYYE
ncbi:MAG: acetyl-CoA carboxylase, carboxyltransferase subunit beta [Bacilli bacterium]